jgi:hypothetical protein
MGRGILAARSFLGSSTVEHAAVNRRVVGSNPTRGARPALVAGLFCRRALCLMAKCATPARMAELVDAHDSGSCDRKVVEVRVLFRAQVVRKPPRSPRPGRFFSARTVRPFRLGRVLCGRTGLTHCPLHQPRAGQPARYSGPTLVQRPFGRRAGAASPRPHRFPKPVRSGLPTGGPR